MGPLPVDKGVHWLEELIVGVPEPDLTNALGLPLLGDVNYFFVWAGGIRVKINLLRLALFVLQI